MQVVIPISALKERKACLVYLQSPEWDSEREALVYTDWAKTVTRLMSTPNGRIWLGWLAGAKLVPMSVGEFNALRKARQ